jgi:hypothetical protein
MINDTKIGLNKGRQEAITVTIGYQQGYDEGYVKRKKDWAIWVTCYTCKKPLYVMEEEVHRYIIDKTTGLLRHKECSP